MKGKIMVKPTKNKIRIIISIVAAVVLLTLLIANSAAFRNISVSSNMGISPRTMGSLTTKTQFQQYFIPAQAELSYIEVRFATYTDETAKGTVQFELLNSDSKVISSKSVPMKDLQDDACSPMAADAERATMEFNESSGHRRCCQ